MQVIECTKYGPPTVLEPKEVAKPIPKDNEILVQITATTVTAGDCEIRSLNVAWWVKLPLLILIRIRKLILGMELAGEVESVGNNVTQFASGDQVFAAPGLGGYAQYICLAQDSCVTLKPTNMTDIEAAAVPVGALNALHFLRKANIKPGSKVLIHGASGSIGTFAIQIAKYFGAQVTAVCHGNDAALVKSLGAENVIDYTQQNFNQNGQHYDVILCAVGKTQFGPCLQSLSETGCYLLATPTILQMLRGLLRGSWVSKSAGKKVINSYSKMTRDELVFYAK